MMGYWAFWKRGWWAFLLHFCINLVFGGVLYLLGLALGKESDLYMWMGLVAWIAFGAPISGWLFEYFASRSPRLLVAAENDSATA